jgi:monoamine oxidase
LDFIAKIHANSEVTEKEITDSFVTGKKWCWTNEQYSLGAFALFTPGQVQQKMILLFSPLHRFLMQQISLYETGFISRPEGKLHFAGEHTSLHHAWIEGSIESAIRQMNIRYHHRF